MDVNVYDFDYSILDRMPVAIKQRKEKEEGKKRRKKVEDLYINEVFAFDIETTNDTQDKKTNPEGTNQSWMYIWQFQVGDDITVFGRTWEEFNYFVDKILEVIKDKHMVIYVHNLAFEFQFLSGIYPFKNSEVFATDTHKVIRCTMYDKLEFRCSYFLTNLSLEKFTEQMGVADSKKSGARYDYDKIRYPWTEMTEEEMEYCRNDVKGLVQAMKKKMESTGDDITTIPMTSTGYVRRDMKEAMANYSRMDLAAMYPNAEVYTLLREAFRGGNTIANRYLVSGKSANIVKNVTSYDMTSSYPNVLMTCHMPMSEFTPEAWWSEERVRELIEDHRAVLGRFGFLNIRLKDRNYPAPYISVSKCRMLDTRDPKKVKIYNGRLLCSENVFETTLTDIDFQIIDSMYEWDECRVFDLFSARYGRLPKQFRDVVLKYYAVKTELKGIDEDTDPRYVYYCNNKERLNATYGCTVQDPCKNLTVFSDGEFSQEKIEDVERKLNGMRWTSWGVYQWGVWCAAWGRKNLQDGIDAVGYDFVYSDTDSLKVVGNHKKDFDRLNKLAELKAKESGAYATDMNGVVRYMGVWDKEKGYDKPNRFCTMGAKKYVVERPDKSLHLTISGVIKDKKIWDPKENKEKKISSGTELKKLEKFTEGFVFKEFGKVVVKYNNVDMYIEREGHQLHITNNIYMRNGEYTLSGPEATGLTPEDLEILESGLTLPYADVPLEGIYMHALDGDE